MPRVGGLLGDHDPEEKLVHGVGDTNHRLVARGGAGQGDARGHREIHRARDHRIGGADALDHLLADLEPDPFVDAGILRDIGGRENRRDRGERETRMLGLRARGQGSGKTKCNGCDKIVARRHEMPPERFIILRSHRMNGFRFVDKLCDDYFGVGRKLSIRYFDMSGSSGRMPSSTKELLTRATPSAGNRPSLENDGITVSYCLSSTAAEK